MDLESVLRKAIELEASDIFVIAGVPITFKVRGTQQRTGSSDRMLPDDTRLLIAQIYEAARREPRCLNGTATDDDFSVSFSGIGRFRVNLFSQRGSLSAAIRVIRFGIPKPEDMHIPPEVMAVAEHRKGMVLVTGQTGSGKSTTLACIVDKINHQRVGHILTLEDPVEYVHRHDQCIVSQREIHVDCPDYVTAMRSALRESPDVILLGEMRDRETIEVAMSAAEAGQLLLSSLHTTDAANSIDRIIDAFPANQQAQVRLQLSMLLQSIICQQLVPDVDGNNIPVFEIMHANLAIRNMIRESKTHQLESAISSGAAQGMCTMDQSLWKLYQQKRITKDTLLRYCKNMDAISKRAGC